jgi:hypothetical protein
MRVPCCRVFEVVVYLMRCPSSDLTAGARAEVDPPGGMKSWSTDGRKKLWGEHMEALWKASATQAARLTPTYIELERPSKSWLGTAWDGVPYHPRAYAAARLLCQTPSVLPAPRNLCAAARATCGPSRRREPRRHPRWPRRYLFPWPSRVASRVASQRGQPPLPICTDQQSRE